MTIQTLISTCPAPVSTAEGVSTAIEWLYLVYVFCIESTDANVPTRLTVADKASYYYTETVLMTTEYNTLNNRLMHIKFALDAIKTYLTP